MDYGSPMGYASQAYYRNVNVQFFHGALSFAIHSREVLGFQHFFQALHPETPEGEGFSTFFWKKRFLCLRELLVWESKVICTSDEKKILANIKEKRMTGQGYSIYNAVYALAHAVNSFSSSRLKHKVNEERAEVFGLQPWQVRCHIQEAKRVMCD